MTDFRLSRRAVAAGLAAFATSPAFAQQSGRRQAAPQQPATPTGEARFTLNVAPGKARLRPPPAPDFDVWTVDGQTPGRPLRMKLGQEAVVTLRNNVDQPLSLHWQGVRGLAAQDGIGGFSQEPVAPGASAEFRFTPPDAGTFFYRPVVVGQSARCRSAGWRAR